MLDNHASVKQVMSIKHTRMTGLTSFLRGCYLPSLLRPMLPSVGGFAISSDGYFYAYSCPLCNLNILWNKIMILHSYEEQVMTMCHVQE